MVLRVILVSIALLCCGCNHKVKTVGDDERFPEKLSEWHLFTGKLSSLTPNEGVIPYELNTPLFSNYATKRRFVWMPRGSSARYKSEGVLDFPVGTILTKTFSYDRLIETRLLVRTQTAWYPLPYVWNAAQTEAVLNMSADPVRVVYRNAAFNYGIPNANQCAACHGKLNQLAPLGPNARNLNRDHQLENWTRIGYLTGPPSSLPQDPRHDSLDARARAYLEVNCRHCHADGLRGDLVGSMVSHDPTIMMPPLGRSLVHQEGVELIRSWLKDRGHSETRYSW